MQRVCVQSRQTMRPTSRRIIHEAMMDVLTSDEPAAAEALSFLLSNGFPTESGAGQSPFVVIAATHLESNFTNAFDQLVLLAEFHADFVPAMPLIQKRVYEPIMAKATLSAGPL